MNPYYTHESDVGPVYDVANYSRVKPIATAFAALAFAFFTGLGAVYFWNPDWIDSEPSEIWVNAHQETKEMMKEHPIGMKIGVGLTALFSAFCLVAAISCICNSISGNYHIRVGEGGISLRVPDGLAGVLEQDFPWSEISHLRVVQEKRAGGTSRNAGNVGGELQLQINDGTSHIIRLDHFKQDPWLIHKRIEETKDMLPAKLGEDDSNGWSVDNDEKFTLQGVR